MPKQSSTFSREKIKDAWPELYPLFIDNNVETGAFSEFAPSFQNYRELEEQNLLSLFVVRKDNEPIGYASFFVYPHHHSGKLIAQQDALYLKPNHRGITGYKFLKWVDLELQKQGIDSVLRQVTVKKDFTKTLLSLGYEPVQTTFIRRF